MNRRKGTRSGKKDDRGTTPPDRPGTSSDDAKQRKNPRNKTALVVALIGTWLVFSMMTQRPSPTISLSEALLRIESGDPSAIAINDARRTVVLEYADESADATSDAAPDDSSAIPAVDTSVATDADAASEDLFASTPELRTDTAVFPEGYGPELVALASKSGVEVRAVAPETPSMLLGLLYTLLPVGLIVAALVFLQRRGGAGLMGSFSKMPRNKDPQKVPSDRFSSVAGLEDVVDELREVVQYLHEPDRFQALGGKVPHGFLLVGPPGTGKTMLARCVAGEAGVPFFALSGSDFVETFVGVGAARVRGVFDEARKAGRAIVFIDELDAVGRARGTGAFSSSNEESERTLNALLVEMDGYQRNDAVIVLAATNRPEILDQALLRPGRFDRQILVPLPDRDARAKILALQLSGRPLEEGLDLAAFARRCPGCSGADLAFIVNEASLQAAREGAAAISFTHLEHARAVAALGRERRSAFVSDKSRNLTAWHEAGHALAALVLESIPNPVSVSIVPRGITGGATWLDGQDESFISRRHALDQLTVTLAGRAGEEVLVGDDYTSGATGDLQQATALATRMVAEWGFVPEKLSFRPLDEKSVAAAVESLLQSALASARALMVEHAALHSAIATSLLEEESLDADRLTALAATHAARASHA
jgi:cell division protease FtsH